MNTHIYIKKNHIENLSFCTSPSDGKYWARALKIAILKFLYIFTCIVMIYINILYKKKLYKINLNIVTIHIYYVK